MILSSFFWGYALTQVPGGMVAQRWGASRLFAVAMAFCALATLAIPEAARVGGFGFVCGCRVFSGLCQGVVPPIIHTLLAKWVPLQERGIFTSFVYSGGWIGNVIALQSAGQLSDSRFGWPACFYFWGLISLLWALLWFTLGKESPAEHPRIRADEKLYIESSLGVVETTEAVSTPWGSILCSVPVWALLISQCAQAWGFWMLLTKLPTYLDSVLKYKIQEVSSFSVVVLIFVVLRLARPLRILKVPNVEVWTSLSDRTVIINSNSCCCFVRAPKRLYTLNYPA